MEEIIELSSAEAREFFLQGEGYCNFDVPSYFDFEPLLKDVWDEISGSELHSYYSSPEDQPTTKPKSCEGVNFTLLQNKDGRFAWRPLELIHPVLYVDLWLLVDFLVQTLIDVVEFRTKPRVTAPRFRGFLRREVSALL